jgi:polyisoprenoid-binding protein YceI
VARSLALAVLISALLTSPFAWEAPAESRRWVPVAGKSLVGFDASHPLGDFSGVSEQATGEFEGDAGDLKKGVTGWLAVAVTTIKTGDGGRDRDLWKAFESERFPEIRFTGRVRLREGKLWVRGENRIKMSDFAISPPRRLLLKVKDSVLASFNLNLAPAE